MSRTTGVQNLLVNTFRPVYAYDTTSTLYTVKVDLSNVNTYYGNSANVLWAQVGDSACNVYVGKESGNDPTVTVNRCSNVTAVGWAAASNASNVSNSAFLGKEAGTGAQTMSNMVGIGYQAGIGTASVRVGAGTSGAGISNTVLGTASTTGAYSNSILIGPGLSADKSWRFRLGGTQTKPYLLGDISTGWLGIVATSPVTAYTVLDISGDQYVKGNLGINIAPGTRTLDVNGNFRTQDSASNRLDFSNGNFTVEKGSNTMSFSNSAFLVRDTCLNTISYVGGQLSVIDASSAEFDVSAGTTRSSGGFYSTTGVVSTGSVEPSVLGPIKMGLIFVSLVNTPVSGTTGVGYVFLATSPSILTTITSYRIDSNTTVFGSGTNLVVSNSVESQVYNYSVTYFPVRP
jgi:hypothetical protein